MNKARRKELGEVIRALNEVCDKEDLSSIIDDLDNIKYEEEDYYNNIPENLQSSQRADDSETAIYNMEDALTLLNEAYDMEEFDKNTELIKEAIDKIEDARW